MNSPFLAPIITDWEELADFCKEKRQKGMKIVLSNGVFDLLHSGHIDSLRKARAQGDVLMVGINTDESVQRLKGPGRPILPLIQRLRVLSGLEMVDCVTCFDQDTPEELLRVVKPEVLVKGAPYQKHEVVGYEFVESYGGQIVVTPAKENISTTNIVETVKMKLGKDG